MQVRTSCLLSTERILQLWSKLECFPPLPIVDQRFRPGTGRTWYQWLPR